MKTKSRADSAHTKSRRKSGRCALAGGSSAVPVGVLLWKVRDWKRRAKCHRAYEKHHAQIGYYYAAEEWKTCGRILESLAEEIRLLTVRPKKRQPQSNTKDEPRRDNS